MKFNSIISIIRYTILQNFRNKTLYVLVLFVSIMFVASFLFSTLGGEQEKRLLFDLGIGCIEIFGLIVAVFTAVTLLLEELESRTIYLVLSRPIMRYHYIIGRYAGLLLSVALSVILMGCIHFALLLFKGWEFDMRYFLLILLTLEKISVISSIALFFSLFSTSAASSIVFTLFFWVLGHFAVELRFLGSRLDSMFKFAIKIMYYLVPNLQYFNLRDQWDLSTFSFKFIGIASIYGIIYIMVCLSFCTALFNRKEF
ncbi:MAG: ABC transporter permease subunit [bacterium]